MNSFSSTIVIHYLWFLASLILVPLPRSSPLHDVQISTHIIFSYKSYSTYYMIGQNALGWKCLPACLALAAGMTILLYLHRIVCQGDFWLFVLYIDHKFITHPFLFFIFVIWVICVVIKSTMVSWTWFWCFWHCKSWKIMWLLYWNERMKFLSLYSNYCYEILFEIELTLYS